MTTLRRELRQKILDIIHEKTDYVNFSIFLGDNFDRRDEFVDSIADAAISIFEESKKPKIDLSASDPAWAVLFGKNASQEELNEVEIEKKALETFEIDMNLPKNWTWYPARTSEDKAWKILREFVVEKYKEDPKAFEKYQTWRTNPFARGAISNLAIKRRPEEFPASWSDYLANSAVYGTGQKPTQQSFVENDENGVPKSY